MDPTDEDTRSVARPFPERGVIDDPIWTSYWKQIGDILRDVFKARTGDEAFVALKRLKDSVEGSDDPAFGAAIYNNGAFAVAADLAGADEVTVEQKVLYVELMKALARRGAVADYDVAILDEVTPDQLSRTTPDEPRSR